MSLSVVSGEGASGVVGADVSRVGEKDGSGGKGVVVKAVTTAVDVVWRKDGRVLVSGGVRRDWRRDGWARGVDVLMLIPMTGTPIGEWEVEVALRAASRLASRRLRNAGRSGDCVAGPREKRAR